MHAATCSPCAAGARARSRCQCSTESPAAREVGRAAVARCGECCGASSPRSVAQSPSSAANEHDTHLSGTI
eukprot:6205636-Pleurochrysis_carterae.AAC.7